jgi:hypothetical protein
VFADSQLSDGSEIYYKAKPIEPNDLELIIRYKKKKLPYNYMVQMLKSGYSVFVAELNRKTAHSAKKILSEKVGKNVEAYQARSGDAFGYVFEVVD